MGQNIIPEAFDKLRAAARDMINGLHRNEVAIGFKLHTEASMTTLLGTAETAENLFGTARGARPNLFNAVRAADDAGTTFISNAKRVLSNSLGARWSVAWVPVGFKKPTLEIPGSPEGRQELLKSMTDYLTANPGKENVPENITAAEAEARFTALKGARDALTNQGLGDLKDARDTAVEKLRVHMRGLVNEMDELLSEESHKWHEFGLNRPADPETPEAPEDLTLTTDATGRIVARWPKARRAERYDVFRKILGTDAAPVRATTVDGLEASFNTVPHGATVEVEVRGANAAGDGPFSVARQIVVA